MPVLTDAELREKATALLSQGKQKLQMRAQDPLTQQLWGARTADAADRWAQATEQTTVDVLGATAEAREQGLASWEVVKYIGERLSAKRPGASARGAPPPAPPSRK